MIPAMTLQFWGVRGSIPTPGPTTVRYGGNTACVSVELGHDTLLVLDAGTGIRPLGKHVVAKDTDIFVLLSHTHWDHIQGFPFFAPLYQPHRLISLADPYEFHPVLPNPCANGWHAFSSDTGGSACPGALSHGGGT